MSSADIEDIANSSPDDNDDDNSMLSRGSRVLLLQQGAATGGDAGSALAAVSAYQRRTEAMKKQQETDLQRYSPSLQTLLKALPVLPMNEVCEAPNAIEQGLPRSLMEVHEGAVSAGAETYADPATGYTVFTRLSHLRRGKCCGNACRHCPFAHVNVSADRKLFLKLKQVATDATKQQPTQQPQQQQQSGVDISSAESKSSDLRLTNKGEITGAVYTRTGDKGTSGLFSGERRPKSDPIFDVLGTVDELNSHIGVARVEVELAQRESRLASGNSNVSSTSSLSCGDDDADEDTAAAAAAAVGPSPGLLRQQRRNPLDLAWIQERLLDCGALIAMASKEGEAGAVASNNNSSSAVDSASISAGVDEWVRRLEQLIDAQNKQLPALVSFILPCGGTRAAAQLHVARSVCRRAERCIWTEMDAAAAAHQTQHVQRCESVAKFLNRLSDFLFTSARLWSSSNEANSAAASEFRS